MELHFVGIPCSFRKNKSAEDGGGLKFTVELDEQQANAWKALSDYSGKLLSFTVQDNH